MLKIGVIIISISVNKCCNHDKIAISPIFKMAAAAILDFEKKAIVGAWHHPDLISRGSEDSKTVLTSNTCFFKGVKVKIATIPPDYRQCGHSLFWISSIKIIVRWNPNLTPLKKHVFEVSTVLESSDPLLIRSG